MARYIPLSAFSDYYESQTSLLDGDHLSVFIQKLQDADRSTSYSFEEISTFIKTLQNPSSIVFYGWIEQNPVLYKFLSNGELNELTDADNLLSHQLSEQFKKFITPFLSDRVLSTPCSNNAERKELFSFVCLLETESRGVVEHHLFKPIKTDLERITKESAELLDEQQLTAAINDVCSDEIIYCVNALSREMYASKVFYVEALLKVIKSGGCTARLANWILKRLDLLKLNQEHADKIIDLRNDLRTGQIRILNNTSKRRTPLNFKTGFSVIAGVLLVGTIIFLIVFKDLLNNKGDGQPLNSSFKQFTKEERHDLDSLLKELRAKRIAKDYDIDTSSTGQLIMPTYLTLRQGFLNTTMESIYSDWNKDGLLQQMNLGAGCSDSSGLTLKRRKNEDKASTKQGKMKTFLINETAYDLIVYISDNKLNSRVYSLHIPVNETGEILMDEKDVLFCVAGRTYQPFDSPQGVSQDLLPSFDFDRHFCKTDYNYLESINSAYEIRRDDLSEVRLIVDGNKNEYFQIVDLNNVIVEY